MEDDSRDGSSNEKSVPVEIRNITAERIFVQEVVTDCSCTLVQSQLPIAIGSNEATTVLLRVTPPSAGEKKAGFTVMCSRENGAQTMLQGRLLLRGPAVEMPHVVQAPGSVHFRDSEGKEHNFVVRTLERPSSAAWIKRAVSTESFDVSLGKQVDLPSIHPNGVLRQYSVSVKRTRATRESDVTARDESGVITLMSDSGEVARISVRSITTSVLTVSPLTLFFDASKDGKQSTSRRLQFRVLEGHSVDRVEVRCSSELIEVIPRARDLDPERRDGFVTLEFIGVGNPRSQETREEVVTLTAYSGSRKIATEQIPILIRLGAADPQLLRSNE
jgi:hypothetical protein